MQIKEQKTKSDLEKTLERLEAAIFNTEKIVYEVREFVFRLDYVEGLRSVKKEQQNVEA